MPDHLPLEAWERSELLSKLWNAQQIQKNVQKELDRRGQRDEWKWAYEVPVYEKTAKGATVLTSAYMLFDSATEAYDKVPDIARRYERDPETAPYHVHKVWLPAQRIEARSDETPAEAVQPEGREPGPKDAPKDAPTVEVRP